MKLLEVLGPNDLVSMLRKKLTKDGYDVDQVNSSVVQVTSQFFSANIFVDNLEDGTWNWVKYRNFDGKLVAQRPARTLEQIIDLVKSLT